tara:strand:- start:170 stop:445 length:276 start_codon:yes stop_codon:yes gene_type:complete
MGSYFTTPETELNEKSMEDCQTPEEYAQYFKRYNDENPNVYCKLAIKKLPSLTESQKIQLNNIVNSSDLNDIKWDSYCTTLTMEQINYVGW